MELLISFFKADPIKYVSNMPNSVIYTVYWMAKKKTATAPVLKGWAAIARFMGTTPASAQTWAKQGMPVNREGRFAIADPAEVQAWLGRQSHMPKPAHILTNDTDIASALKESISVVKRKR
jgi:hypothetical protein